MQVEEIRYVTLPTLRLFHECTEDIRCIVGPVGSGKTTGASVEIFFYIAFFLAEEYGIKKTRWVILRNTYRELAETTMKTVFEWFPWGIHKKADQTYTSKDIKQYADSYQYVSDDISHQSSSPPDTSPGQWFL